MLRLPNARRHRLCDVVSLTWLTTEVTIGRRTAAVARRHQFDANVRRCRHFRRIVRTVCRRFDNHLRLHHDALHLGVLLLLLLLQLLRLLMLLLLLPIPIVP